MLSATLATLALASSLCVWASPTPVERADVTITDGSGFYTGTVPNGNGLKYQSSGFLESGGCAQAYQHISNCYEIALSSDPTAELIPDAASPRQRTEFLNDHQPDGTSWHFTWKQYFQYYDVGGPQFFHTMQIFSAGDDAPAYYTDLKASTLTFYDYKLSQTLGSVALSAVLNRTLAQTLDVTYGPSGKVHYTIADEQTGAVIYNYQSGTRSVGTGGTYLKFGAYRGTYTGMSAVKVWQGDYTVSQTG